MQIQAWRRRPGGAEAPQGMILGTAAYMSPEQARASATTQAPPLSPISYWQTISDVTGQPQSVVQIYESRGRLFARVEKVLVTVSPTRTRMDMQGPERDNRAACQSPPSPSPV